MSDEKLSVIRPCGYSASKCGYCKGSRSTLVHQRGTKSSEPKSNPSSLKSHSTDSSSSTSATKSSLSYSVLADSVSPTLYEELIHRGWRRSGLHLYKPQNFSSCCPTLTTRLLTRNFMPSKSQRRVLKKMENIFRSSQKHVSTIPGTITPIATPISMPSYTSKKQKKKSRRRQDQRKKVENNSHKNKKLLLSWLSCWRYTFVKW